MEKIRYGVVGLGHRGRCLGKLAAIFDCAEFAAACDIKPTNWFEKQWLSDAALCEMFPQTKFYEDYDEMLEKENLDVVIVETGADIHAEFCCKALRRDINVLSDIPVVASLKEAEDIWKAVNASKGMFMTGSNPDFQKFSVLLKDFFDKGLLGKPYYMEAEYIHWSLPQSAENIHLNENGDWRKLLCPIRYCTHSLGPLLRIIEEELRYVSCFGTGMHADDYPENYIKKDDMQCAQFKTESGIVVRVMRNGRCRADIGHHNYRVFGTQGYMEKIDRYDKPVIRYNSMNELDTKLKETTGEYMPPEYANDPKAVSASHGGVDYAMVDYFFKALINGKPSPVSIKHGLIITLPGIYAEESAKRNGEVLKIKYPWDEDWNCDFK